MPPPTSRLTATPAWAPLMPAHPSPPPPPQVNGKNPATALLDNAAALNLTVLRVFGGWGGRAALGLPWGCPPAVRRLAAALLAARGGPPGERSARRRPRSVHRAARPRCLGARCPHAPLPLPALPPCCSHRHHP